MGQICHDQGHDCVFIQEKNHLGWIWPRRPLWILLRLQVFTSLATNFSDALLCFVYYKHGWSSVICNNSAVQSQEWTWWGFPSTNEIWDSVTTDQSQVETVTFQFSLLVVHSTWINLVIGSRFLRIPRRIIIAVVMFEQIEISLASADATIMSKQHIIIFAEILQTKHQSRRDCKDCKKSALKHVIF